MPLYSATSLFVLRSLYISSDTHFFYTLPRDNSFEGCRRMTETEHIIIGQAKKMTSSSVYPRNRQQATIPRNWVCLLNVGKNNARLNMARERTWQRSDIYREIPAILRYCAQPYQSVELRISYYQYFCWCTFCKTVVLLCDYLCIHYFAHILFSVIGFRKVSHLWARSFTPLPSLFAKVLSAQFLN